MSELLDEYGVPADRIILELSEGELLGSGRRIPALRRLRDLGVRLSVDDFGAGGSSFADLSRLPVQEVKIDRTFVQGMATGPSDLAIVRTVVDMSRHFGLAVVAEGVESELTLGLLEDMRCDIGPGLPVQPRAALRAVRGLARRPGRSRNGRRAARSAGCAPCPELAAARSPGDPISLPRQGRVLLPLRACAGSRRPP